MRVPSLLEEAKKQFEEIQRKCTWRYRIFNAIGKTMTLMSVVGSFFLTLNEDIGMSTRDVHIVAAIMGTITALSETYSPQKSATRYEVIRHKSTAALRQINAKVDRFKEYFQDVEEAAIPEEFSTKEIMDMINRIYEDIDQISLLHLTEGSYEKLLRLSSA